MGPVGPRSEQFKIWPSVGRTTTNSPSRTTLTSAVRLANSGSLSVHSVPARDHSRAREGFNWARQRYPSSLLSCAQPPAAGGTGTAVGSMGRKGTVMSPTSVADPGPDDHALGPGTGQVAGGGWAHPSVSLRESALGDKTDAGLCCTCHDWGPSGNDGLTAGRCERCRLEPNPSGYIY